MYITCPECKASFVVDPGQLGPEGRKVKCSKCQNIWHASIDASSTAKIEPTISTEGVAPVSASDVGVHLPALLPVKLPVALCTAPIVLIMLIAFISVSLFSDTLGIGSAHEAFDGLMVSDINVEHKKDASKIVVSYKVVNNADHVMHMPNIRIRLLDKNARVLQTHTETAKVILEPKQYVSIKTDFVSVPPSAKSIDMTLGNQIDFWLR